MTRTNVTEVDEIEGRQIKGWFDPEKATRYDEATWDAGNGNHAGVHRGGFEHEILYRTAAGRWVRHYWSQYAGVQSTYEFITPDEARLWLIANEDDVSDAAIEEHFGQLPEEHGPEVK